MNDKIPKEIAEQLADALNLVKKYSYKELMYLTQGLLFWLEDNAETRCDEDIFGIAKQLIENRIDVKEETE